ncbi:hypothetical protein [Sinisalibacter aestuarii]|uniref:Uncharacterized protein n=1 Tax=Sinisalibacter aestuarii TaxID=2949426 RepID=A0ABQ5LMP8_9RHOB|nr:hypothetical protein [Sinisalibacter aestuarii]GKY86297.1 hypothetical protein STA1M1_01660 [Sinisalibacter aestuarii]
MSGDPLDFGPDRGLREAWLFTLFVTSDEADRWEPPRPGNPRDWPLVDALGAGPLEPGHVSVFEAGDLGKEGLRKFLIDAIGMDADQVNADAGKLDMIRGTVALVQSAALTERPGRFTPARPANFIGHYAEHQSLAPATPFAPGASTRGHIPPANAPAPDTRRGLILTIAALVALVVLVLALT